MSGADFAVLKALLRGLPREGDHAQRLQAFYAPQAGRYDAFRERLLYGRREMVAELVKHLPPSGGRLLELGGGTGRNLEFFGDRLHRFERVDLVDLCPALLQQAQARQAGLPQLRLIEADACRFQPEAPADCVYISYALSMIPDWQAALSNAVAMLKPGGLLGVVDFYVSPDQAPPQRVQHNWLERRFWPRWFGHDGVRLDAHTLPQVLSSVPSLHLHEGRAPLPWLPGCRVPYFYFVGRKPAA